MATTMKSFRLDEDAIYDLEKLSDDLGESQSRTIAIALEWFLASGASSAIKDLNHLGKYKSFRKFREDSIQDGKIRETVRRNNGLGIAPLVY